MYAQTIGSIKNLSASTRHLLTTLNLINSRRGWRDLLEISNRDLLATAGYDPTSRYGTSIIKRFHTEATAAGLIAVDTKPRKSTVYLIAELTADDVAAAKAASIADKPADKLSPKLAAKLAENAEKARRGAAGGTSNIGKVVNISKGATENGNGDGSNGSGGDDADAILRSLVDLGV